MYSKIRLFSPAPHQGILLPLAGIALEQSDLVEVPVDTDCLLAVKVSARDVQDEIRRVLGAVAPEASKAFPPSWPGSKVNWAYR